MKVNSEKIIPQANKIFTDREEPRKVFWDTYKEFKSNLDKENDIKVITYYGIGGIGKTTLIKQIRKELIEKVEEPRYIYMDFSLIQDSLAFLKSMRNKLQDDYKFEFPLFDLAIYIYLKKIGEDVSRGEIKSLTSRSQVLSTFVEIGESLPVVGFVSTVIKNVDNLVAATRNYIKAKKEKLYELETEEPYDILKNLQYYFALDLKNNLSNINEPFIVFFDTYEALVNELSGLGEPLRNDEWIRDLKSGLITNIPNTIWVIAGREKIKWEQFNKEWVEALDQHLLGDLSESDTDFFLENAGISDKTLRKEIYITTRGIPVYLDICVNRYYDIIENGEPPTIERIGKNIEELIERFVRYMDDSKQDFVYLLSCLDEWNDELLFYLAPKVNILINHTAINKIKGYSFITSDDSVNYTMHQIMKEVLYKACPETILAKINTEMELYLSNKMEEISPSNTEHIINLKRYIGYKLTKALNSTEFSDFYDIISIKYIKKLKDIFQYSSVNSIYETLLDYSVSNFGKNIVTAKCYSDYSQSLYKSGRYEKALANSLLSYRHYEELLGLESSETIKVMNDLSTLYLATGKYEEALKIGEKSLQLSKECQGEEHVDTIDAMYNLTEIYWYLGRYKENIEMIEKVIKLRRKVLGKDDPDTIKAMNAQSVVYWSLGKYEEAIKIVEQVLELRKKILGEEHLDTISTMNNLGVSYSHKGRHKEAVEIIEQVLELRKRILGEEHPITIKAMYNLSIRYSDAGRKEEALKLSERVLNLRKDILGEEHPDTLKAMNNLSVGYSETGRKEEALELGERLLELRKRILGEEHPDTIRSMNNLSVRYREAGKKEEALKLIEKVLELRKRILGKEHPDTIKVMNILSMRYSEAGKKEKALKLSEEVLELRKKVLGEEHPDTIRLMHNLSTDYSGLGRKIEALELGEKVLELRKRVFGEEHLVTISAMYNLSVYYSELGRKEEALELTEKVLELRIKILGEEHQDTIKVMNILSMRYRQAGRKAEALELGKRVLKLKKKTLGDDHPNTIKSKMALLFSDFD